MKQAYFTVLENTPVARGVYRLVLAGDASDCTRAGTFVNVKVEGFYLRRPLSVCDVYSREEENDTLVLMYKTVGGGTEAMSRLSSGARLDLLTGLGNGFESDNALKYADNARNRALIAKKDAPDAQDGALLVGGGMGAAPLYMLAKQLYARGVKTSVILGFNTLADVILQREMQPFCSSLTVATADGSSGNKGIVTDFIPKNPPYVYACGPLPMLKAVYDRCTDGEFSFEERMGCGFGACMGCTCKTADGAKQLCKDGPVLKREEIIW